MALAACAVALLAVPVSASAHAQPAPRHLRAHAHAAIVGGTAATPGMLPSLAFVLDYEGSQYGLCSGTVVAANVILTAAHCVLNAMTGLMDPASNFAVVTGDVDWSDTAGRQVSAVSSVAVYPAFNLTTLYGDAAVLVLTTPTTAPAIPLATSADASLLQAGTPVTIAGWGDTTGGVDSEQTVLQSGALITQSPTDCALYDGEDGLLFDPTSELCAFDPPSYATAACHGDSGGPAIAAPSPGAVVEIGITSRGDPGCATTVPNIFTRVDLVQPWVASEIAAVAPAPMPAPVPVPVAPAATSATTTPAAPTTPAAAEQGRYTGSSSQRRGHVNVVLGPTGITRLNLEFNLHCTRGKRLRGPLTETASWASDPIALVAAQGSWTFSRTYRDTAGDVYTLAGALASPGSASGTLSVATRNHACTTGVIRWNAVLPA